MACSSNSQALMSLCDRLKQRYENNQQNWQSLFQGEIREKNVRDNEFIRYIVNTIIEQAKHNIVISELPDVIRTLHCEAEALIRKNRMITLEEAINQVQQIGAKKYPYLKRVKPLTTEDFVREVMREVFNRIGTIITLDMIENICQFTTCSAKQLLCAMPAIDVNEASSLIIEDILRNQHEIDKDSKDGIMKQNIVKERSMIFGSSSPKSTHKTKQTQSPKNSSYSQQLSQNSNNQIDSTEKEFLKSDNVTFVRENKQHNSTKKSKSSNISANAVTSFDSDSKLSKTMILPTTNNTYNDHERKAKVKYSQVKSDTQTYSIHSQDGLPTKTRRSPTLSSININDNAIVDKRIDPATSLDKMSSKHRPFILEVMHKLDQRTMNSHSKTLLSSMRYYTKYCHDNSDSTDNEELTAESDMEYCPLGAALQHRFTQ